VHVILHAVCCACDPAHAVAEAREAEGCAGVVLVYPLTYSAVCMTLQALRLKPEKLEDVHEQRKYIDGLSQAIGTLMQDIESTRVSPWLHTGFEGRVGELVALQVVMCTGGLHGQYMCGGTRMSARLVKST